MERIDVSTFRIISEEPRGYSDKYWINDDKKKLVKYNGSTCLDQDIMEYISCILLNELGINCVKVILGYNPNKEALSRMDTKDPNCCIIDSFLENKAEVAISLANSQWVKIETDDEQKKISSCFYKMFRIFENLSEIKPEDLSQMKTNYIRTIFGDCIIDNEDRRLKNIETIYNEQTRSYHLAPSFDNGLAFNAFNIGDTEGYCYIGNQEFSVSSIIEYIVQHHLEEVSDIIENLDIFVTTKIEDFIKSCKNEIPQNKLLYIYEYIINANKLIKNALIKTDTKTK